jgi:hypothetical protein
MGYQAGIKNCYKQTSSFFAIISGFGAAFGVAAGAVGFIKSLFAGRATIIAVRFGRAIAWNMGAFFFFKLFHFSLFLPDLIDII